MESKNVIAAISLSAAVIILYSLFFAPSQEELKQKQIENKQIQKSSDTPDLVQNENFTKLNRKDALAQSDRVQFENENIVGSIS